MAPEEEDKTSIFDELLGKVADYGKEELELVKLKAIDKVSEKISSTVPGIIVIILVNVFLLFLNLGVAIWVGELLGNLFYGFFAVAAFYGLIALILRLFMYKWLKKQVGNSIIKRILN